MSLVPGQFGEQAVTWWFCFLAPAWASWRQRYSAHNSLGTNPQVTKIRQIIAGVSVKALQTEPGPLPHVGPLWVWTLSSAPSVVVSFRGHPVLDPLGDSGHVFPKGGFALAHPRMCPNPNSITCAAHPPGLAVQGRFASSNLLFKHVWIKSIFSTGA